MGFDYWNRTVETGKLLNRGFGLVQTEPLLIVRDAIVPSFVDAHWLEKGEDEHCWMKSRRCLSTPSEPPLRPLYWLFRVATTSLHISCINTTGCAVWLEKTHLHFKMGNITITCSKNVLMFHSVSFGNANSNMNILDYVTMLLIN